MPRVTRSATKARRRKERRARLEGVLAAAEAAFLEDGYPSATTDIIAVSAGVSVGTVYNFLGDKDKAYEAVIERIGEEMTGVVQTQVLPVSDPEAALDELIQFRLNDFARHRLLLVVFSSDRGSGACPAPESLTERVSELYFSYLDMVTQLFEKGRRQRVFERIPPLQLALSFEGILNAFVGYWMLPGKAAPPETQTVQIKDTFMKMAGWKRARSQAPPAEGEAGPREVYVTTSDMARLKEAVCVAHAFGSEEAAAHLDDLVAALAKCKVVESSAVPEDVVTMNSRVRVKNMSSQDSETRRLVFPSEADTEEENLSVLDPLGTALLGRRPGAVVDIDASGHRVRYMLTDLLYQPEASGEDRS